MIYFIIGILSLVGFYIALFKSKTLRNKALDVFKDDYIPDLLNAFLFLMVNIIIVLAWPVMIILFGIVYLFNYLKKLD